MLAVIKTYQHNDLVITVAETADREYARTCFEDFQIDREDNLPDAPLYYIVSSGLTDSRTANGVTVFASKIEALHAAQDEYKLWKQWDVLEAAEQIDVDFGPAFA